MICALCEQKHFLDNARRCEICATVLTAGTQGLGELCLNCLCQPPAFDHTVTLGDYANPLDQLVMQLKFRANFPLAQEFANRLAHRLQKEDKSQMPDLILPVPLSVQKLAKRGFNQAWEIARLLAKKLDLPASARVLHRVRHTSLQAGGDFFARHKNVQGAFEVDSKSVEEKHILLIDDVMTTGATCAEIAKMLKHKGVRRVTNAIVLRTPIVASADSESEKF